MDPILLTDKILNLSKLMSLGENDRQMVINLFNKLLDCYSGEKGMYKLPGLPGSYDLISADILYRTLVENDYLITVREKRIDDIINE
jgi:hypothetical protein